MKLSSSNFTLVDSDDVVGTSNFASRNIFVLQRQHAHFSTITKPVTYCIASDWTITRELCSCQFIRQYLGWQNLGEFSHHVPFVQEIVILMWSLRNAKTGYFIAVMMQAQMNITFTTCRCMKQAFIKQKLNVCTFFHNNWHKVKYVHEVIHAGSYKS